MYLGIKFILRWKYLFELVGVRVIFIDFWLVEYMVGIFAEVLEV